MRRTNVCKRQGQKNNNKLAVSFEQFETLHGLGNTWVDYIFKCRLVKSVPWSDKSTFQIVLEIVGILFIAQSSEVVVPMAQVACTVVKAPLMLKSTCRFQSNIMYAVIQVTPFSGTFLLISARQCRATFCTCQCGFIVKRVWVLGVGTRLASLPSRPVCGVT